MGNQSVAGRWAEQPSTINMMYNFTGLNYYKFADVIDFVSWDNYPTWHKRGGDGNSDGYRYAA